MLFQILRLACARHLSRCAGLRFARFIKEDFSFLVILNYPARLRSPPPLTRSPLAFLIIWSMKLLKEYIRKTLAHRHMGNQMVGAVALNAVRTILHRQKSVKSVKPIKSINEYDECDDFVECIENQSGIEWYVRFHLLFLKTDDQALKIQIFKQKNQILQEVNLALEKVGYATRVDEIRLKN